MSTHFQDSVLNISPFCVGLFLFFIDFTFTGWGGVGVGCLFVFFPLLTLLAMGMGGILTTSFRKTQFTPNLTQVSDYIMD